MPSGIAFVYGLEDCPACEQVGQHLDSLGYVVDKITADNPLLQLAICMLHKDGALRTPVIQIGPVFYLWDGKVLEVFQPHIFEVLQNAQG
jgi:hypothetical protein